MRQIKICGETWLYKVGRKHIIIKDPMQKKIVISFPDFTGMSWYELERLSIKNRGPKITPRHIADYIKKNLTKTLTS